MVDRAPVSIDVHFLRRDLVWVNETLKRTFPENLSIAHSLTANVDIIYYNLNYYTYYQGMAMYDLFALSAGLFQRNELS